MLSQLRHIRKRREVLRTAIDTDHNFEQWKETCVPSYCHSNVAAAYVSWMRLFSAVRLMHNNAPKQKRVLDFGSSVGELGHLLDPAIEYNFVEQDEAAAAFLMSQHPKARQQVLEAAEGRFDCVFAIDALEHNDNFAEILIRLATLVSEHGIFLLSGPTENALYRLGRRIAGFSCDYHVTTIYDIESAASHHLDRVAMVQVPLGVPLFRISAWRHKAMAIGNRNAEIKQPCRGNHR